MIRIRLCDLALDSHQISHVLVRQNTIRQMSSSRNLCIDGVATTFLMKNLLSHHRNTSYDQYQTLRPSLRFPPSVTCFGPAEHNQAKWVALSSQFVFWSLSATHSAEIVEWVVFLPVTQEIRVGFPAWELSFWQKKFLNFDKQKKIGFNTTLFPGGPPPQY